MGAAALGAEPCLGAKGDISRESALFDGSAAPLAAGKNVESAPTIAVDRLYRLDLVPQDQVRFAAQPGRSTLSDGYAGLATLTLDSAGAYRVAIDTPLWVDVVGNGELSPVRDFQALRGCEAPRKIVEFELSGGRQFVLQLSGSGRPAVRLTITRAFSTAP